MAIYNAFNNVRTREYEIKSQEGRTFGNGRYSLRIRFRTLRPELGERISYVYDDKGLADSEKLTVVDKNSLKENFEYEVEKIKKKKKLVKNRNHTKSKKEEDNISEYNSDILTSENITEYGDDDARILKIPKGNKKSLAKNFDTLLVIKIIEADGKNAIKVDDKIYKNLKSDNEVKVDKNQEFEILNFSENNLVVQLLFDVNN